MSYKIHEKDIVVPKVIIIHPIDQSVKEKEMVKY